MFERIHFAAAPALALALWAVAPAAAAAEEAPRQRLEAIERALHEGRERARELEREAGALEREVGDLRARLIAAAAAARREETAVVALERRLRAFEAEEASRSADLKRRHQALAATLGALQRLAYRPPEALIVSAAPPVETLRSALLLGALVPELEARAAALGAELSALKAVREEVAEEKQQLVGALARLDKERQALDRLIERQARRHQSASAAYLEQQRRLARLAAESKDLHSLMARIANTPAAPDVDPAPPRRSFMAARGTMPFPVLGTIARRFGEPGEFGRATKGITILARRGAEVIAPHDGRIVFAGPFRGYGLLLIISHGERYHTLIAGMARIDGVVGQRLLAGEPVGRMGEATDLQPRLYVELRRAGEPINPLPWLSASEGKVSG